MENIDVRVPQDTMRAHMEEAGITELDPFAVQTQGEALLAIVAEHQNWAHAPTPGQLIEVQYAAPSLVFVLPDEYARQPTAVAQPLPGGEGWRMQRGSARPPPSPPVAPGSDEPDPPEAPSSDAPAESPTEGSGDADPEAATDEATGTEEASPGSESVPGSHTDSSPGGDASPEATASPTSGTTPGDVSPAPAPVRPGDAFRKG